MGTETKPVKTNEQFLTELQEGKISFLNILFTPYSSLRILLDTREVDDSYKDEDGDWIHSTKTVIDRKALLRYEDGNYSFLFDNWFDDIDNFEIGLYAKVRLGSFYNLVNPLGEYLFSEWHGDIEFYGNNLIYCYTAPKTSSYSFIRDAAKNDQQKERVCSIYDRRGHLLHQNVIVKAGFINGKSVITKDGLSNYIDSEGKLLSEDWFIDAHPFENIEDELFAFVKNKNGWGVINHNGNYAYPSRFSHIRKAEWSSCSFDEKSIAIVEDDNGQNILMSINNCNEEFSQLVLGLPNNVDSIYLLGRSSLILVKLQGEWGIYEWDRKKHQFDCSVNIGELDSVEEKLYQIKNNYFRLVKKEDKFNVIGTKGIIFDEWYSEILVYGNLFKVKRPVDASRINKDDNGGEETSPYEFNLISPGGSYKLDEWVRNLAVTPFDGALLVNIKPKLTKGYNGGIFDASFTHENVQIDQSSWRSRIKKIEGSCNIIMGDLLFDTWHDGIEFLNGKIYANGYLKVWKDGKCNLIDDGGDYASPEWVDDFVMSRWNKDSYYSDLKAKAFLVKKANRMNLLSNGKFILDQWFTEILRYNEPRFLDTISQKEVYSVRDGYMNGIYYIGSGLVGGRLYETISRISKDLYFCRFDKEGHIMSLDGKIITTAPIREVQHFKDGYAMVTTAPRDSYDGFKFNFINDEGILVSSVWFDGDRYMHFNYSDEKQPRFVRVKKDSKYNLLTTKKELVFKKWYDSISGDDGKWLISDESRGELKYNFIDNSELLLCNDWFKEVRSLRNLDEGIYAVETEQGYNVLDKNNEYTLSKWSKEGIYDDDASGLAVIVDYSGGNRHYYYLDHSGHFITPYWSYDDSVKKYYCTIGEKYEEILILDLHEDDFFGGYMQIICKRDGTPFFKDIIHRPYSPHSTGDDDYLSSVFGSIEEYSVPGKDPVLLIDKHWPVKNDDIRHYAIMDYNGKELSEEFESIGKFDEDGFAVVEKFGRFNIINKNLRLISSLWFEQLGYEYKSKETEYSDYMDYETGMVESSPYQVERIRRDTSFHDGNLKVELAGSFNLMNQAGMLQFPIWYDSLIILSYGYYKVGLNSQYNIVDSSNKPVSDVWFDKMGICKRDYEKIIYGGQKGDQHRLLFIRESSALVSDNWFDKVGRYDKSDGYYSVRLNGKKNFVTDEGKLLVPGWHDDQLLFRDYNGVYVVVQDGDKFNIYSSRQSKLLSDEGFDKVIRSENGLFSYGWCGVQVDGKYTFVNEDGQLAEGRFDAIHDYRSGYAGVILDGKKNYLTSEGTLLSDVWFEETSAFAICRKAVVKIDGKLNVIDSSGALLLSDEIHDITSIGPIEADYCVLTLASAVGKTIKKYYDFKTSNLHDSERSVKDYLEALKADAEKPEANADAVNSGGNDIADNPAVAKRNKQIRELIEKGGKAGINYTLVSFGDKSNLVDKNGAFIFEEWIDSISIQMCQGVPLIMNVENKWILIK